MKKTNLYFAALIAATCFTACTGNSATTTSSDSTSQITMNPGDSSVTSTTTTTVTHHRYSGSFAPQPNVKYLDLKTRKNITVRIDTERGEVVNTETNEPVYLFVETTKHDTIYGQSGSVVNNYIFKDESGDYKVDTVRIYEKTPAPEHTGNYKEKVRDNKTKIVTDDVKIKEKNGVIKTKER